MTLKEALSRVVNRRDLTREEMASVMGQMLAGEATAAQVGGFAVALRMKGENSSQACSIARVCPCTAPPR